MAATSVSTPIGDFVNASEALMGAIAQGISFTQEEHRILTTLLPLLIDYVMVSNLQEASKSIQARL